MSNRCRIRYTKFCVDICNGVIFWSYWENPGGGQIPPPPAGRGLTEKSDSSAISLLLVLSAVRPHSRRLWSGYDVTPALFGESDSARSGQLTPETCRAAEVTASAQWGYFRFSATLFVEGKPLVVAWPNFVPTCFVWCVLVRATTLNIHDQYI